MVLVGSHTRLSHRFFLSDTSYIGFTGFETEWIFANLSPAVAYFGQLTPTGVCATVRYFFAHERGLLHSTTLDRSFAVSMVRQKKDEKRERSRERKIGPEAKNLRVEVENWVKKYENTVAEIYDKAEFPCLESFGDRTIDIAEPLVAIVEVAYQGHPEADRAKKDLIHAIASTRREQQSASPDHLLLKHLLALAENEDPLVGNASELAAQCANLETPIEQPTVSRVLRKYGFKTKPIRKDGEKPLYRYSLSKAELMELVERWASEPETVGTEGQQETAEQQPDAAV
jgi:uncharacterized protein DUF3631